MPVYKYQCRICGKQREVIARMGDKSPLCCGVEMSRQLNIVSVRDSNSLTGKRNELWLNRIDEIHKRQADKGERLRLPHPSEVLT